jgi:hypothetical protein
MLFPYEPRITHGRGAQIEENWRRFQAASGLGAAAPIAKGTAGLPKRHVHIHQNLISPQEHVRD